MTRTGLLLRHTSAADGNLALHTLDDPAAERDAVANRRRVLDFLEKVRPIADGRGGAGPRGPRARGRDHGGGPG